MRSGGQRQKGFIARHALRLRAQNLALNVADKGFSISVYNRSTDKTEAAVKRAQKEGACTGAHPLPENMSGRLPSPARGAKRTRKR